MNPTEEQNEGLVPAVVVPLETRAVTKFSEKDARELGLPSPTAINFMMSVANLITRSALITQDMGVDLETIKANAMAKMLIGHEMGLAPMEAMQEIDIVKGRLFLRYPTLINEMLKRGFGLEWKERSNDRAVLIVTPPGKMKPETFEYSYEDAKLAQLVKPDSQYVRRPRVMLSARVVSEAYRATGGRSNVYTPEEKQEIMQGDRDEPSKETATAENPYHVGEKPAAADATKDIPREPRTGFDPPQVIMENTKASTVGEKAEPIKDVPRETNTQAAPEKGAAARATADAKATEAPAAPQAQTIPVVVDQKMPADQIKMVNTATASTVTATNVTPPSLVEKAKALAAELDATVAERDSITTTSTTKGAPEPSKSGPKTLKAELDSISELIPQLSPETLKKKHFIEFFRGFFNISKIGKADESRMLAVIPVLRAICKDYSGQFQQDPHGSGVMAGAGYRGLTKYLGELNFPEDFNNLAHSIALERYADSGGGDLIEFLQDVAKVNEMGIPDARAFLQVFAIARGEAMRLKVIAGLSGKGIQQVVVGWNQDLMKMTEASVKALLDDAERIAKANPAPAKVTPIDTPKPAAPAIKMADDEEELSLFDLGGE